MLLHKLRSQRSASAASANVCAHSHSDPAASGCHAGWETTCWHRLKDSGDAAASEGSSRLRGHARQDFGFVPDPDPQCIHLDRVHSRLHTKRHTLACTLPRWTTLRMLPLVRHARKRMDADAAGCGKDLIAADHSHGHSPSPRRRRQPSSSMAARAVTFAWTAGRRFEHGSPSKNISASTREHSLGARSGDTMVRGSTASNVCHCPSARCCGKAPSQQLRHNELLTASHWTYAYHRRCIRKHTGSTRVSFRANLIPSVLSSSLLAPGTAGCRGYSAGHRRPCVSAVQLALSTGRHEGAPR